MQVVSKQLTDISTVLTSSELRHGISECTLWRLLSRENHLQVSQIYEAFAKLLVSCCNKHVWVFDLTLHKVCAIRNDFEGRWTLLYSSRLLSYQSFPKVFWSHCKHRPAKLGSMASVLPLATSCCSENDASGPVLWTHSDRAWTLDIAHNLTVIECYRLVNMWILAEQCVCCNLVNPKIITQTSINSASLVHSLWLMPLSPQYST